jgi:hypothetical protein
MARCAGLGLPLKLLIQQCLHRWQDQSKYGVLESASMSCWSITSRLALEVSGSCI